MGVYPRQVKTRGKGLKSLAEKGQSIAVREQNTRKRIMHLRVDTYKLKVAYLRQYPKISKEEGNKRWEIFCKVHDIRGII